MKKCSECGAAEGGRKFPRGRGRCHACQASWQRVYNERNRLLVRAINSASKKRHADGNAVQNKKWRASHPDKVKAYQKKADAKIYARKRALLKASPERQAKARAAVKSWYERNKERSAVYFHRRRARLAGVRNDYTQEQWAACKEYFAHRCAYCLAAIPLEMEHMVPVAMGGEHSDGNIVPACEPCNRSKHAKTIVGWLLSRAA